MPPEVNPLLSFGTSRLMGNAPINALLQPPNPGDVTPAEGWAANAQAAGDFIAQQRAQSAQMGYLDPATGFPTRAGLLNAAGQYGNALLMGSTEARAAPANALLAYHGSPHSFERFSLDKIGTGEGAQAYGHGLYFAGNEAVAKGYRDRLTDARPIDKYGRPVKPNIIASDIINQAREEGYGYAEANDMAAGWSDHIHDLSKAPSPVAKVIEAQGINYGPSKGHMYQVQINAHPDHFLDWDKPLSEQHPVVQDALKPHLDPLHQKMVGEGLPDWREPTPAEIAEAHGQASDILGRMRGGQLYDKIAGHDPAAASQALQASGIPGLRYLDQGSRGGAPAGDPSHNLVVFNDANIDILKKYGIAGLGIGGAAAAQSQAPADAGDQAITSGN
jgi:hypothetical protein